MKMKPLIIAKSVLLKLGDVVLDKHQFSTIDQDAPHEQKSESASSSSTTLMPDLELVITTLRC